MFRLEQLQSEKKYSKIDCRSAKMRQLHFQGLHTGIRQRIMRSVPEIRQRSGRALFLKALEIQGFKSFPDKVRLPFEKRMTAIVGPNGSGKSNIADALCWVMGEQRSKTLRGSKMEDVIFGGTSGHAPSAFAQVSLILDNEDRSLKIDADEVMLTRRYYRSGESEYFINRRSVRLKDVSELLMDTGLGRDGYSLVGQGRVDEILAAKSTERREIFEEAAGISRFRHRKEETARKLERTEDNLLRVGDKIAELELQVEPLRKQAAVAKKYLVLRDELRDLEISLWLDSLEKLDVRRRELRETTEQSGAELQSAKDTLEQVYAESETCTSEIQAADIAAEALRGTVGDLEKRIAALENDAAAASTERQSNIGTISRLSEEDSRQTERESELRAHLAERRSAVVSLNRETEEIAAQRTKLFSETSEAERKAAESAAEYARLTGEAAETEADAAAERARAEELAARIGHEGERLSEANRQLERQRERLQAEESAAEQQRLKLEEQRAAAEQAGNASRGFELKIRARTEKQEAAQKRLLDAEGEQRAAISRHNLLADMEKEYEGFSRAVRTVMRERERGNLKHIHGTVAELIDTDDAYTVAIETAMGGGMQNIVVDSEEDGKEAIRLLKRLDAGRATFMPLSTMRGSLLKEPMLRSAEGILGIAAELVRYERQYEGIILHELGRTVVARDLDAAIALSRRAGGRLRIVTLDGQLINAGGSMTGGSAAKNVGVLSRANELRRLKTSLESLQEEISRLKDTCAAGEKELAASRYESERAREALRQAEDACLRTESELKQREALLEALREAVRAAETGAEDARKTEDTLRVEAREAENRAEEKSKRASKLRSLAESGTTDRRDLEAQVRALAEQTAGLQAREAALQAEIRAAENGIAEWEGMLSHFRDDTAGREQLRIRLTESNHQLEERAEQLLGAAGILRGEAEQKKAELETAVNRRREQEGRRARAEKNAQDLNRNINVLEREYAEQSQKLQAADQEERLLLDKLWDNYELSRSAAERRRQPLESLSAAQKQAGKLRREIGAMGTPNLGAIEEFERVNERYSYLTEQRDDIEKAKKELLGVVDDLTEEMRKIFAEEFASIAAAFSETFRELFGGGRGELLLENPEDILNCGIEIRVQPPGKALRMLSLLSGGERAFVAITLYFAMLKVRPAPFCVLDEIESALDESNVSRFADYARRMSEQTQFLIITHRRGSMEAADTLYGVTMQKGISRVLSIELNEALETGTNH